MTSDETRFLLDEALAALARVTEAWPWLAEVRVPGKSRPIGRRPLDPYVAARADEAYRRDRQQQILLAARGVKASGPHADAARIAPLAARAHVSYEVRLLCERLADADTVYPVLDPASRPLKATCRVCRGRGHLDPPPPPPGREDVPQEAQPCRRCHSHGTVPYRLPCIACGASGPCGCDHADAVMALAVPSLARTLPQVTDADVAADALRVLERCDRAARDAAGVGEDRRVIKAPCPACGRFELYAEVSSQNKALWVIRCGAYLCACAGPACGCGRDVRWPGRRHLWPAREWDGPEGLAARLGVDLPGTARPQLPEEAA